MSLDSLSATRKTLAILRILNEQGRPLGATRIARELARQGIIQSERMVRMYLERMDNARLTENFGRQGRAITARGREELSSTLVIDKIGFVGARADMLAHQMTYNLERDAGSLVTNVSIIPVSGLAVALAQIEAVFRAKLGMGELVAFAKAGEPIAGQVVPEGHVAIATVCALSVNGIMLKAGIPMETVFGGLLEIDDHHPRRFTEIIRYDGSTLDPVEVFIQGFMTSVSQVAHSGRGRIGVGFRMIPATARNHVLELQEQLDAAGFGTFRLVGEPDLPLLDMPVGYGRVGLVLHAGLNVIAAVHERGVPTRNIAMCALLDRSELYHYSHLRQWAHCQLVEAQPTTG